MTFQSPSSVFTGVPLHGPGGRNIYGFRIRIIDPYLFEHQQFGFLGTEAHRQLLAVPSGDPAAGSSLRIPEPGGFVLQFRERKIQSQRPFVPGIVIDQEKDIPVAVFVIVLAEQLRRAVDSNIGGDSLLPLQVPVPVEHGCRAVGGRDGGNRCG